MDCRVKPGNNAQTNVRGMRLVLLPSMSVALFFRRAAVGDARRAGNRRNRLLVAKIFDHITVPTKRAQTSVCLALVLVVYNAASLMQFIASRHAPIPEPTPRKTPAR